MIWYHFEPFFGLLGGFWPKYHTVLEVDASDSVTTGKIYRDSGLDSNSPRRPTRLADMTRKYTVVQISAIDNLNNG